MPMHDWSRVSSGTYHNFHQLWTITMMTSLNRGTLPPGYYAMADQRVQGPEPDVVAFHHTNGPTSHGGLAVLDAPPKVRIQAKLETSIYARKANRLRVYDNDDRVVAIIEIVSPGNKDSQHAIRSFVSKSIEFLNQGIHQLIVDPFPPSPRDPEGIHQAIWDEVGSEKLAALPDGQQRVAVAFDADVNLACYVEPFAVGEPVPTMPLFLAPGWYVNVPLEESYRASWESLPQVLRDRVQVSV